MPQCSVVDCRTPSGNRDGLKLFPLPKNVDDRNQWVENIARLNWTPTVNARVCSKHFIDGRPTPANPFPVLLMGHIIKLPKKRRSRTSIAAGLQPVTEPSSHVQSSNLNGLRCSSFAASVRSTDLVSSMIADGVAAAKLSSRPARPAAVVNKTGSVSGAINRHQKYRDFTNPETPAKNQAVIEKISSTPRFVPPDSAQTVNNDHSYLSVASNEFGHDKHDSLASMRNLMSTAEGISMCDNGSSSDILNESDETYSESDESVETDTQSQSTGSVRKKRTDLGTLSSDRLRKLVIRYKTKYRALSDRCRALECRFVIGWESLSKADDKQTVSWTGFPSFETMEKIYKKYLKEDADRLSLSTATPLKRLVTRRLSREDEFVLTMVRLRVNLTKFQLAHLFGLQHQYVSTILAAWLPFLSAKFSVFLDWIPKSELGSLPEPFKLFPNCVAIVNCFELIVQKPSSRLFRQKLWNGYKQHYAAKFLVVMSPNGTVMYVSLAWGGRMSDINVVKNSTNFLQRLQKGDDILADQGFDLQTFFATAYNVNLRIPAIMQRNLQQSGNHLEESRQLSRARILVERCIADLKTFRVLQQTLPVSLFPYIDDITTICAAVRNMHPSLLK